MVYPYHLVELSPFELWFASAILIVKATCEEVENGHRLSIHVGNWKPLVNG